MLIFLTFILALQFSLNALVRYPRHLNHHQLYTDIPVTSHPLGLPASCKFLYKQLFSSYHSEAPNIEARAHIHTVIDHSSCLKILCLPLCPSLMTIASLQTLTRNNFRIPLTHAPRLLSTNVDVPRLSVPLCIQNKYLSRPTTRISPLQHATLLA